MLPTLSSSSLNLGGRASRMASPGAELLSYERSRYALMDAYRLCGAGDGTAVLIPAYHCRTMLDPAIRLGAQVRLYPLREDLTPDLDALEALLRASGARPVALLATHFFGFQQDFSGLMALCDRFDVTLVEDCSHCLFPGGPSSTLGATGLYSVWSPYKFYPCEDGGMLQVNRGATVPQGPTRHPGGLREAKRLVQLLLRSRGQPARLHVSRLEQELEALTHREQVLGVDVLESTEEPSIEYTAELEQYRALAVSRAIMARADVPRIRARRRMRFEQWLQATSRLPACQAFQPILPEGCVPYMFPLYIERPETHFLLLKQLGMPVWRWDNMAKSSCPVSRRYRAHLLQLPCHQELSEQEMAWLIAALGAVLKLPSTSG